ncbi:pentapeptide repeat-containing protein [uncultured Desulfosarcina sp.]|uniref:pentapeptide repeat-containing protein n=1 Tax=uncultured Desulfosarcina sp. TaxID=218289 RepID=UPI0029C679F3|nr:pentapeptide repeat-containing protein [uncultured Desulfosarcina sp.]
MKFPTKSWDEMNSEDQDNFRNMSEKELVTRWNTDQGIEIKKKIIKINFSYGNSKDYKSFIGTVKTSWGKSKPKIDLRGINFSYFSNLKDDEIFRFDFSNCALTYSDFSRSEFTSSNFKNSDILYSNFSNSFFNECDFSHTNLTLTDFDNSNLEEANFRSSWLSDISLNGVNLGFIKFDKNTDFQNIDVSKVDGSSNPLFLSFIRRKHYLKHFKTQSTGNKIIYYLWLFISDCGQSFFRWTIVSLIICLIFGFIYSNITESFILSGERTRSVFSFYYYSVVTFTTLGFGDIVPNNMWSEIVVTIEVILGYIMLGGLISIFATKLIPKD